MVTFLFLVTIVLFVLAAVLASSAQTKPVAKPLRLAGVGTLLLTVFLYFWNGSVQSVPAGHRGILLTYGKPSGVLNEGMNFTSPVGTDVKLVDVRTQKAEAQAAASSKDLQSVRTNVAVNFHPDPTKVAQLYSTVGTDYESKIIDPAVQETIKAAIADFTARDLIQKREEVKTIVDEALSARLAKYNIVVEPGGVSLTNFEFSESFNESIEATATAQQEALRARQEQTKIQIEAENKVTQAKAEAEAKLIAARGDAQASQIRAKALNAQGGSKVLAQQWISRWDGTLPTITSGGSNTFMIDLRTLLEGKNGG